MRSFFLILILFLNLGMIFFGLKNLSASAELQAEVVKLTQDLKLKTEAVETEKKNSEEALKKFQELQVLKEKVQEELAKNKKEAESLAKELASEKQKRKELEKKLKNAEKEVEKLKKEVQREKEEKTKLQERLDRMASRLERSESDKGTLLNKLSSVMKERDAIKNKLSSMETKPSFTLAEITVSEQKQYAGIVLNVNEKFNFCIASIGKNDGILPGIELVVHRGTTLVGKIVIERVFDRMSSAKILSMATGESIKVEDSVRKF